MRGYGLGLRGYGLGSMGYGLGLRGYGLGFEGYGLGLRGYGLGSEKGRYVRLPAKGNSNSHGARPFYQDHPDY